MILKPLMMGLAAILSSGAAFAQTVYVTPGRSDASGAHSATAGDGCGSWLCLCTTVRASTCGICRRDHYR
jgi:hypothetical protein